MSNVAAQRKTIVLRARAEKEQRKREGRWKGGMRPHVEYQERPLAWMIEKMGIPEHTLRWSMNAGYDSHAWDGTKDPLLEVLRGLVAWEDVGVESGTGTGKTFLAALVVLWFLACFENSFVISTAPKKDQLSLNLWKEIRFLWPTFERMFPDAELLDLQIRMRGVKWSAHGIVAGVGAEEEVAARMKGFHASHMLFIIEEAVGMPPAIMKAIQNTCTAPHNLQLALGNPDSQHDPLHKFCIRPGVRHIRISAYDHPNLVTNNANLVPGAASWKSVNVRKEEDGEDSPVFQAQVRGISPPQSAHALIRLEWCKAAVARYNDPDLRLGEQALGVDIAESQSGDKGAIARGLGACLTEVESFQCPDATDLADRVFLEAKDEGIPGRRIGADSAGLGGPVVNYMKKLGLKVQAISGGTRAIPQVDTEELWSEQEEDVLEGRLRPKGGKVVEAERFNNLRSQVWWRMREDLRRGRIALPDDEELLRDLTTPTFRTKNGVIWVEAKEDIVKRLGRSPDKGDAAVMWNWVRSRVPTSTKLPPIPTENEPNRDYGLERIAVETARAHRARARQMRRRFGLKGAGVTR